MVLSSILSYFFIMLVLYISASIASRRYALSIKRGVTNPPFLTPEVLFFIVFFTVVFAIRYNVGVDYVNYLDIYESGYKIEYGKNEFLFKQVAFFWYNIGAHPAFYFGTFVLIQITFFLLFFKNEKFLYPFFVVFLFCNGEVINWMNLVRAATAMCIWIYSIKYIEQKKFWKYLLLLLLAFGFHRSALLYIIMYPILAYKEVRKPAVTFQCVVLVISLIIRNLFVAFSSSLIPVIGLVQRFLGGSGDYYMNYDYATMMEDFTNDTSGTGIAFLVKLVLDFIIVLNSKKLHAFYNSRRFNIIYVLFFIGLFFFYCFPDAVISFSRPFRYFFIFRTILLAYFAYYLWKNQKVSNNQVLLYLTISIYLGLFVFAQIVANESSCLWYQTWFNQ